MQYAVKDTRDTRDKISDLKTAIDHAQTDNKRVNLLTKLARILYKSTPEEALNYATEALHLAYRVGYQQGIGSSSNLIGVIHWYQGNFKDAEEAFMQALDIRQRIDDTAGMAESYNCLGTIYLAYGVYAKSLEYFIQSLKTREQLGHKTELADCYNNIGLVYEKLGDHIKSLDYHQRSLKIRKEINNKIGIAYSYSNTGNIYKIKGEYDKALNYYFKSLEITQKVDDNYGMAHCYSLVGEIYCTLGHNEKALKYLSKALSIQEKLGDKAGKAISLNRIGEVHARRGKYEDAIDYYYRSLAITRKMSADPLLESVYHNLAQAYSAVNDYKSAYKYHVLYSEAKSKLFNEDKANAVALVRSEYEYEKKNQEIERLNSEQNLLRESKNELELFAGKVAHDLKEPLRMMSSFGTLLEDNYQNRLDENGKEYLSIIKDSSVQMQTLLSDLLEFALSGNPSDNVKQTNLNDTLIIVQNNLRLRIKETKTKLIINELPTVKGSFSNMVQLYQNLISNAIKFKKPNTTACIRIGYHERDDAYLLFVQDNGIGIAEEHKTHIFQVFTHLDPNKEGTGIGLATCKKIVKNLNGKIWVESQPGQGSTFYFTLSR